MLGNLKPQAPDKILALMGEFKADPRQGKIDLGVGVYKDADGHTPIMRAVKEAGVATIPVSALYEEDHVTTILRLCLAKNDETLDAGVIRLAKARELSLKG